MRSLSYLYLTLQQINLNQLRDSDTSSESLTHLTHSRSKTSGAPATPLQCHATPAHFRSRDWPSFMGPLVQEIFCTEVVPTMLSALSCTVEHIAIAFGLRQKAYRWVLKGQSPNLSHPWRVCYKIYSNWGCRTPYDGLNSLILGFGALHSCPHHSSFPHKPLSLTLL